MFFFFFWSSGISKNDSNEGFLFFDMWAKDEFGC